MRDRAGVTKLTDACAARLRVDRNVCAVSPPSVPRPSLSSVFDNPPTFSCISDDSVRTVRFDRRVVYQS